MANESERATVDNLGLLVTDLVRIAPAKIVEIGLSPDTLDALSDMIAAAAEGLRKHLVNQRIEGETA